MHRVIDTIGVAILFLIVGLFFGTLIQKEVTDKDVRIRYVTQTLPSKHTTPGWINRFVKQSTLDTTVCIRGYSTSIRPPSSYTRYVKKAQLRYYSIAGLPSSYEEDHFIPISLGGSPYDTRNLWPEPKVLAKYSDRKEIQLWHSLCKGDITLRQARTAIVGYKLAHG